MNKTLLIEIKDTKAIVTLTTYNGKVNLLYRNNFYFKPLKGRILFDSSWITKMQFELKTIIAFEAIKNIILVINVKETQIKFKKITINNQKDILNQITELKTVIKAHKKESLELIDPNTTIISKDNNKIEVELSYELIDKSFYDWIINSFAINNIEFTKITSVVGATKNILLSFQNKSKNNFIFNVNFEAKHILISVFQNGQHLKIIKLNGGMNIIYQNIATKMGINSTMARFLFNSFGYIPPKKLTDNKIIYAKSPTTTRISNEKTIFSKKDLASYITEIIDNWFKDIKEYLSEYIKFNPFLLFSGEISTIIGFKEYAQNTLFSLNKIGIYHSNIIGLDQQNSLIIVGALEETTKNIIINKGKEKMLKGDNYLVKKQHIFSRFITKINWIYSYI